MIILWATGLLLHLWFDTSDLGSGDAMVKFAGKASVLLEGSGLGLYSRLILDGNDYLKMVLQSP